MNDVTGSYAKKWDFTVDEEHADWAKLDGAIYVECLPDPKTPPEHRLHSDVRYVELEVLGIYGGTEYILRIYIQAVSDRNQGFRSGEPVVEAGGPAVVDLTTGALKCAWPVARSGSVIIPNIFLYYNSRDHLASEINNRLAPERQRKFWIYTSNYDVSEDVYAASLSGRFWSTLDMRLIRGADAMMLIDHDGRRVCFRPEEADDDSAAVWKPAALESGGNANPKSEFSEIRTVTQTRFGVPRMYYLLLREPENRQYLFEHETGKLLEIREAFNNFALLEYEEYGGTRGLLKRVVDNRGIFLNFIGDGQDNLNVVDPLGRTTEIS